MPKYNTGPCAPRVIKEVAEKNGIGLHATEALVAAAMRVDDTFVSMLVVVELAHFVQEVKADLPLTPLVYPGIYDVDTDLMLMAALRDWEFEDNDNKHCLLVAGQHPEASNRPKLKALNGSEINGVKIYSQANADNTPQQAAWVADMVEQLGLEALAIRAHPFHGARAFLTQLATFKKRGLDRKVVLLPWWRPFNPFAQRPLTEPWPEEVWSDAELIPGEAKRIHDYSAKGDVASLADLKEYVDWLAKESPAAEALIWYTHDWLLGIS